jgi:hypothetical protein
MFFYKLRMITDQSPWMYLTFCIFSVCISKSPGLYYVGSLRSTKIDIILYINGSNCVLQMFMTQETLVFTFETNVYAHLVH